MSFRPPKWVLLILVGVLLPASANAQRARFSLSAPVTIATGDEAGLQAVAVGNLNGDARPDIVVVSPDEGGGPLAVLINNGDGTYAAPRFVADEEGSLSTPVAVAIADVGSVSGGPDGKNDIIVVDIDDGFLVVFDDGAGNFTVEGEVTVVDGLDTPVGLALGDFDGQNGLDLAIIDEEGPADNGEVHFFCNQGSVGLFAPCPTGVLDSGGEMPIDVGVGDFNGDGNLDVLVLNQGPANTEDNGRLALFVGNGGGAFSIPQQATFSISRIARDLAIGDINPDEDSNDDAVVVDDDTLGLDNTTVFFGTTSGAILLRRSATLELGTTGVTIGSFAGSAAPDLAGTNDDNPRLENQGDASNIAVLLGNGTSSQPPFSETGALIAAQLGDVVTVILSGRLNDDALDDVVTLTKPADANTDPQLIVGLNTSASATETPGTPMPASPTPTQTPTATRVVTADVAECVVPIPTASSETPNPIAMVKGDFGNDNGDAADLAILDRNGGGRVVFMFLNESEIRLPASCQISNNRSYDLGGSFTSLATGDFDDNNLADVIVAGAGELNILRNMGGEDFEVIALRTPTPSAGTPTPTTTAIVGVAVGDFNVDGYDDVATVNGAAVQILLNDQTDGRTFTAAQSVTIPGAIFIVSGDFDNNCPTPDCRDDLAIAASTATANTVTILISNPNGNGTVFPSDLQRSLSLKGGKPVAMATFRRRSTDGKSRLLVAMERADTSDGSFVVVDYGTAQIQITQTDPPIQIGGPPTTIGAADIINADGLADVIIGNESGTVLAFPANADGTFGAMVDLRVTGSAARTALVGGDFDGPGADDVILASEDGQLNLLLSSRVPPTPIPTATNTPSLTPSPTITTTPGPSSTPTMTPLSTVGPSETPKDGTFTLSSCSIAEGTKSPHGNAEVLVLALIALILARQAAVERKKPQ